MSAWDISGAVAWTALAVLNATAMVIFRDDPTIEWGGALIAQFITTAPAVFCIARLFGAHE